MKKLDLDRITEDTKAMKRVFTLSLKEIEEAIDHKKPTTDLTRLASNTISSYAKLKSAEIHDKALEIMLNLKGQNLLENK